MRGWWPDEKENRRIEWNSLLFRPALQLFKKREGVFRNSDITISLAHIPASNIIVASHLKREKHVDVDTHLRELLPSFHSFDAATRTRSGDQPDLPEDGLVMIYSGDRWEVIIGLISC